MFISMKSRQSLKLGHVRPNTRSLSKILEKYRVPSGNFIAGRPKAALLWFFGGFRCGIRYLSLFLLYINIKIGKNRF